MCVLKGPFSYRTISVPCGQNSAGELRDSHPIVLNLSRVSIIKEAKWYSEEIPGEEILGSLMWDSPLYAMNIFYYYWLIKKLLWPMAGQNIGRQEN